MTQDSTSRSALELARTSILRWLSSVFRAAQALTRRVASDFLPDVNGFLETSQTFGPHGNPGQTVWGLDTAWQIDLWGRIQARVDAESFRAAATSADYHAVALSLAAEISRTWFSLIEARAQLELLHEQADINRTKGLEAVELRFGITGDGGSPNVLRQRQLVESTLEQMTVVRASIEILEHRLAVLTGQPPQAASYVTGSNLPQLAPLPSTGLPAELLSRRPDVRADYLAFAAADRDVEAAVTDQYPRLSLSSSLANVANHPEALFSDWFFSLGGQLIGPILDGGQRRAEVERTRAVRCQRFFEYRQTVLIAMQEVEDALARERHQIQRIEKLRVQLGYARNAHDQLRQRFITGDASFLDILSAIQSQQGLQRTMLAAQRDLILIRIGLYLALAGDFDTRPQTEVVLPVDLSDVPVDLSNPEQELSEAASDSP